MASDGRASLASGGLLVAEGAQPVAGKVVRPVAVGVVHRNDRFRHLYWQNFLAVDGSRQLGANEVVAELDRWFGDLPIRHALFADGAAAARTRSGLLTRGYQESVVVTMVLRREPDRRPPTAELAGVSAQQLAPVVEAYGRRGPRADNGAAVRELCALKHELARNGVRFLAVVVMGQIAGWCELRRYEGVGRRTPDAAAGQVEDVVVLEPFRGRGLARALVCGAVERLRAEGCDPVFLVADDRGTVKDLYARLGFDDCRRTWSFWWPPLG